MWHFLSSSNGSKISISEMGFSEHRRAFISAFARPPSSAKPHSFCPRKLYRRRPPNRWACTLQDDSPEKGPSIPPKHPSPAEQHTQIEGVVSLDSVDVGFEEALSKKWDALDIFDDGPASQEKQPGPEVLLPGLEEEQDDVQDTKSKEIASEDSKEEAPKKKKGRKAKKKVKKEPQEQTPESDDWDSDARWYFVQVKPGCEQSCAISIRNMSESMGETHIHEVLVPTTKIMRLTKGGKAVSKEERFFPGYIIVLVSMSRFSYSQILRIPNVQCFMNDPNRDKKKNDPFRPPLPVKDSEMKTVFKKMSEAESGKPEVKTAVRPGDPVEIISGAYQGNKGRVTEVKPDLNVVKTEVIVYGRISALELEFHQVQVIEEADLEAYLTKNEAIREKMEAETKKHKEKAKTPPIEADVASAEDDLMQLLNDIGGEDESPDDSLNFNFEDEDGFASAQSMDEANETTAASLLSGADADRKHLNSEEEKKRTSDDQLFDEFLFDSGRDGDEGLLSSNDDLASFLSDVDDADLWQLDESEKRPPSMFDDTDDGFEPPSDVKQGASSLIDEAEHPFNAPDDGFIEINKTRHAKRRNPSQSSKLKGFAADDFRHLKDVTIHDKTEEAHADDPDIDFSSIVEGNDEEDESSDERDDAISEEELESEMREVWDELQGTGRNLQEYSEDSKRSSTSSFPSSDAKAPEESSSHPKAWCENLPKRVVPWPEEDELPPVHPDDVHRIGGEAYIQDIYAELRRVEREGDRKYDLPPPGYDESKPIVQVAVSSTRIDIKEPDTREWPEYQEFDYEEVKRKSRAMHNARKEARKRRRENTHSDSPTKAPS
eukprot:TRINITY_DN245_c1_g2_i1.p2 TRINITY_DN245_c1_g2~~TRINITY_DN245_c1_g2_i1.p2  ORF type:complete len:830 (-),score=180.10 TRINITY_DN245_c1_g2_i1:14240-16729(-)